MEACPEGGKPSEFAVAPSDADVEAAIAAAHLALTQARRNC